MITNILHYDDEDSSNNDYLEIFIPKINQSLQTQLFNKSKNKVNELIYGNNFEKEFNKVFKETNNQFSTNEKELSQPIIQKKIFKLIKPIEEKEILINFEEKNEKYFPFTPGRGLEKILKKIGYLVDYISPFEINLSPIDKEDKNINQIKFNVIDYSKNQKGKIKKCKKKRKYKPDDIRKRIKAKFHKILKNIINNNLKNAGSKKIFDFLPQYFISNITIKLNKIALNYTYEELIKTDIANDVLNQNKTDTDLEKYNRNLDVLEYLNNNQKISKVSLFTKIRNMKYINILKAYFMSREFEESIIELHQKKERIEYIEEYINKSLNYVSFYSTFGSYKQSTKDESEDGHDFIYDDINYI